MVPMNLFKKGATSFALMEHSELLPGPYNNSLELNSSLLITIILIACIVITFFDLSTQVRAISDPSEHLRQLCA